MVATRIVDTSGSNLKDNVFLKRNSAIILSEDFVTVPYNAEVLDDRNKYQEPLMRCINQAIVEHELPVGAIGKVVVQKQVVKHLPLTVVNYSYKDKNGNFHVIGNERKVKFDDYPTKTCIIL